MYLQIRNMAGQWIEPEAICSAAATDQIEPNDAQKYNKTLTESSEGKKKKKKIRGMYSVGGPEPTERSEKSDKRLIKGILTHYIK